MGGWVGGREREGIHGWGSFHMCLTHRCLSLPQYVHNLMPRGQYTSGKGSSAVGLTAYVTRDPETRQLVLQT